MSKEETTPGGLLSKVVRFVKNPTVNWTELDSIQDDRESQYSKQMLKEMIERKRRNDFVRKREFDMLRKIRSREGTGVEGPGMRPSFFQSSLPSKPDDRAETLKKIDEIEAQMSMQWWKTKGPDSLVSTGSGLNTGAHSPGGSTSRSKDAPAAPAVPDAAVRQRKAQYDETEPSPLPNPMASRVSEAQSLNEPSLNIPATAPGLRKTWSPTPERQVAAVPAAVPSQSRTGLMAPTSPSELRASGPAFSASHFFALDVQEIAQDPEVEEAAIRFANGDDAGAEQGLLDVLGEDGAKAGQQEDWLALFDLYRATGQLAAFESRAVDFVNRFNRSAPQWYDMPDAVSSMTGKIYTPSTGHNRAVWVSEPELDAHAVGTLQNVLLRANQPWVLDWTPLESMDLKAARALLGIFTLWGDQDVELRFQGSGSFRELLKSQTPSGRRDVEQLWWELRMAVLRVMNRPDEFELTALDFCVTYEVSPPGWEKPRCYYSSQSADKPGEAGQSVLGESVLEQVPSGYPNSESQLDSQGGADFNQLGLVELSGEIRGDPQATLEALERRLKGADVLIISCRHLIRVDFSAAGTLLNWVSGHHAEGRLVQFVDAHRLVSAFFHVIGITEYAKVVVRVD